MALPLPDLQPVPQLLASVYGTMAFCSAVGALHPTLRKAKNKRVRDAINSWWPPALVGGVALAAGGWIGAAVFSGVSAWTLYEFLRMLPETDRNRRVEALAFVAVPLHYGTLAMSTLPFAAVVLVWTFGVLPLAWLLSAGHRGTLTGLPRVQWGIVMTVVGLSYVARLFHLDPGVGPAGGAGLAALLLLAVMSNDAAQYVFGKLFGRRPLAPGLSPKKTWEGFAGGLATTAVICAFAGPLVAPFDAFEGALVGAALAAAGLVGDLLVSGIKRDAGVKDTGAVLPEHGGVLDRCDSLLFAAPLFFHGLQAWLP